MFLWWFELIHDICRDRPNLDFLEKACLQQWRSIDFTLCLWGPNQTNMQPSGSDSSGFVFWWYAEMKISSPSTSSRQASSLHPVQFHSNSMIQIPWQWFGPSAWEIPIPHACRWGEKRRSVTHRPFAHFSWPVQLSAMHSLVLAVTLLILMSLIKWSSVPGMSSSSDRLESTRDSLAAKRSDARGSRSCPQHSHLHA